MTFDVTKTESRQNFTAIFDHVSANGTQLDNEALGISDKTEAQVAAKGYELDGVRVVETNMSLSIQFEAGTVTRFKEGYGPTDDFMHFDNVTDVEVEQTAQQFNLKP